MLDLQELLILFIPMIIGSITSYRCKIGDSAGVTVNARPPSFVFGMVWFILYIFIGISWIYSLRDDEKDSIIINILYSLLIFLLSLWIYFYGCKNNKKYALWTLPFSILIVLIILTYRVSYLLLPLLVWLNFALMLNSEEVNAIGR